MIKTRTTEVLRIERVAEKYICDNCKKEVSTNTLPNDWHEFTSGHDEWGNDSVDSIESYHVCSPACYFGVLAELARLNRNYKSFEANDIPLNFINSILRYLTTK